VRTPVVVIVMGVSGCGKTTVGRLLARKLGVPFYDADDFHPVSNREKMKNGIPLTDEDRWPWLRILADTLGNAEQADGGAVLACSALKARYRDVLRNGTQSPIRFIYLKGNRDLIFERMKARTNHFMPPALLDSQLAALEEPDEAVVVDIADTPENIAEAAYRAITEKG